MLEIWIIKMIKLLEDSLYETLFHDLQPQKQQRLRKFREKEDAQCSLLGEVAARILANRYLNIEKKEMVFDQNAYGKPFLQGQEGFHYNISHSDQYVVCAVSSDPIGVDIEKIKPVNLKVAERFFTENERQYVLDGIDEEIRKKRFFTIWTKKEAYVKLDGRGLRMPLKSFDVLEPQHGIIYTCVHQDPDMICHICMEQEKEAEVRYLLEEEVVKLYLAL